MTRYVSGSDVQRTAVLACLEHRGLDSSGCCDDMIMYPPLSSPDLAPQGRGRESRDAPGASQHMSQESDVQKPRLFLPSLTDTSTAPYDVMLWSSPSPPLPDLAPQGRGCESRDAPGAHGGAVGLVEFELQDGAGPPRGAGRPHHRRHLQVGMRGMMMIRMIMMMVIRMMMMMVLETWL
jgi:hypothetical protein